MTFPIGCPPLSRSLGEILLRFNLTGGTRKKKASLMMDKMRVYYYYYYKDNAKKEKDGR